MDRLPVGKQTKEGFKKVVTLELSMEGRGVYQIEKVGKHSKQMESMNKNREREWE